MSEYDELRTDARTIITIVFIIYLMLLSYEESFKSMRDFSESTILRNNNNIR